MRDDFSEWPLHCAIRLTDIASSICDSYLCGGSFEIRHRNGHHQRADLGEHFTQFGAGGHRRFSSIFSYSERHVQQGRFMERHWQRLQRDGVRDRFRDRFVPGACYCSQPSTGICHSDFNGRSHEVQLCKCHDPSAHQRDSLTDVRHGIFGCASTVHCYRKWHYKHRYCLEREWKRLHGNLLRSDLLQWSLYRAKDRAQTVYGYGYSYLGSGSSAFGPSNRHNSGCSGCNRLTCKRKGANREANAVHSHRHRND